jgi:hypothetical protein
MFGTVSLSPHVGIDRSSGSGRLEVSVRSKALLLSETQPGGGATLATLPAGRMRLEQAGECAEAIPHQAIEVLKVCLLWQWRVAPHAMDEFGMARTSTEEGKKTGGREEETGREAEEEDDDEDNQEEEEIKRKREINFIFFVLSHGPRC